MESSMETDFQSVLQLLEWLPTSAAEREDRGHDSCQHTHCGCGPELVAKSAGCKQAKGQQPDAKRMIVHLVLL